MGAEQGLPWGPPGKRGLQYLSREHAASLGQGRAASALQSPQREDSALELHKEDRRETRERLQEVQTPGGRATAGPEPTIRHKDTHKNWRAITSSNEREKNRPERLGKATKTAEPECRRGAGTANQTLPCRARTETPEEEHLPQPLGRRRRSMR